jgi:hypothetical protein
LSGEDVHDLAFFVVSSPAVLQGKQLLQGSVEGMHEARFVTKQLSKRIVLGILDRDHGKGLRIVPAQFDQRSFKNGYAAHTPHEHCYALYHFALDSRSRIVLFLKLGAQTVKRPWIFISDYNCFSC